MIWDIVKVIAFIFWEVDRYFDRYFFFSTSIFWCISFLFRIIIHDLLLSRRGLLFLIAFFLALNISCSKVNVYLNILVRAILEVFWEANVYWGQKLLYIKMGDYFAKVYIFCIFGTCMRYNSHVGKWKALIGSNLR